MDATLDRFGRILLPKPLRDRLGLTQGDVLEIQEKDDEIRLKPVRGEPSLAQKDGVLVYTGKAAGDVDGAARADRQRRGKKVAARASG